MNVAFKINLAYVTFSYLSIHNFKRLIYCFIFGLDADFKKLLPQTNRHVCNGVYSWLFVYFNGLLFIKSVTYMV